MSKCNWVEIGCKVASRHHLGHSDSVAVATPWARVKQDYRASSRTSQDGKNNRQRRVEPKSGV